MLVVASETYLKAIAADLRDAVVELSDPDLLSIVSAGSKTLDGLGEHLVPCDARLQKLVNGARRSLNTRVAGMILSEARRPPRRATLKRRLTRILSQQPDIQRYDRTPMSDREVRQFITSQLRNDRALTHTALLRRLRDSNHACEQKRFASLFRDVKERKYGGS